MKRTLLATLLLLAASPLLAQHDPVSRSWNQPVEPFRIAGNLYYVGASDITSYLITTPRGHILIDGGFVETVPQITANIRKLGFRVEDVRILLNSHAHVDHAGGLAELKRLTGATLYASARDIPLLARGGLDDPHFADRLPYPAVRADRIIHDGSRVTLGGTTLVARLTPAHTAGCTTWTMRVRENGKPLDVVFVGSASVPNAYRLTAPLIADYRHTFQLLRSLKCDIFLGSHGNFFQLEEKRKSRQFVDPEGYRRYVAEAEKACEERAAR
jgi:metallo-beta-lactamase class B